VQGFVIFRKGEKEGLRGLLSRVCGGRGQRREGVQHFDNLIDETVSQSAGSRLEAPHAPLGGQGTEEAVDGMGGVTRNGECFAGQAGVVGVLDGGKRGTDDVF